MAFSTLYSPSFFTFEYPVDIFLLSNSVSTSAIKALSPNPSRVYKMKLFEMRKQSMEYELNKPIAIPNSNPFYRELRLYLMNPLNSIAEKTTAKRFSDNAVQGYKRLCSVEKDLILKGGVVPKQDDLLKKLQVQMELELSL